MSDGFSLLDGAGAGTSVPTDGNAGNDFFAKFGAVDIGGSDAGNSGASGSDGSGSVGSDGEFDASIHVGRDKRNTDGSYTKRRGRRVGNGLASSRSPRSSGSASVKAIQNSLEGIHALLALATGFEDLKLSTNESEPLAGAVAEVAKHYNIPVVDPKVVALFGLGVVASKVYAPKLMLIKMELAERKEKKKQHVTQERGKVIPFPTAYAEPALDLAPPEEFPGNF